MVQRYYVPELQEHKLISLPPDEAHHALRVMRAGPGDRLQLFDGMNHVANATVDSVSRKEVICHTTTLEQIDRENLRNIVVAVALPKGDRARSVVEKAVELGASAVVPIKCERSVAMPSDSALRRMERYVIDASKQSGRNRLMPIAPAISFGDFVTQDPQGLLQDNRLSGAGPTAGPTWQRVLADPSGHAIGGLGGPEPLVCAIGPEGGFTSNEVQLAIESGWQAADLGPRILRVETAVCVVLTLGSQ